MAGAFFIIDHLSGGWIVLLTVAFGLCALGGWRLMQSLLDLKRCGWQAKGLVRRAGLLLEAVLYAGLGLLATAIPLSQNTELSRVISDEATFAVVWTAHILDWPLGHWIVGAVGVGAIGIGCVQFVKARGGAFEDVSASERTMAVIRLVGWIGLAARGAIFTATGILFLMAAWRVEASDVGGTRAALTALAGVKAWFHKRVTP